MTLPFVNSNKRVSVIPNKVRDLAFGLVILSIARDLGFVILSNARDLAFDLSSRATRGISGLSS